MSRIKYRINNEEYLCIPKTNRRKYHKRICKIKGCNNKFYSYAKTNVKYCNEIHSFFATNNGIDISKERLELLEKRFKILQEIKKQDPCFIHAIPLYDKKDQVCGFCQKRFSRSGIKTHLYAKHGIKSKKSKRKQSSGNKNFSIRENHATWKKAREQEKRILENMPRIATKDLSAEYWENYLKKLIRT